MPSQIRKHAINDIRILPSQILAGAAQPPAAQALEAVRDQGIGKARSVSMHAQLCMSKSLQLVYEFQHFNINNLHKVNVM